MFGTNEHILAVYDTKNDILVSNTLSLENVEAYSVSFYARDVSGNGLPTDTVNLTVSAVGPTTGLSSADVTELYPSIVAETEFADLVPSTIKPTIWSGTYTLDQDATVISDSGFGYKQITCSMSLNAPTTDQIFVVAVLQTTKATN